MMDLSTVKRTTVIAASCCTSLYFNEDLILPTLLKIVNLSKLFRSLGFVLLRVSTTMTNTVTKSEQGEKGLFQLTVSNHRPSLREVKVGTQTWQEPGS